MGVRELRVTDLDRVRNIIGLFAALEGLGIRGESMRQEALADIDAHLKEDAERGQTWDAGYEKGWGDCKKREFEKKVTSELTRLREFEKKVTSEAEYERLCGVDARYTKLLEAVKDYLPPCSTKGCESCARNEVRLRQLIEEAE